MANLISFQDELLPMVQSKNLTLAFSSESSIEEELKTESTADAITIVVNIYFLTFMLVCCYEINLKLSIISFMLIWLGVVWIEEK